MSWRIEIKDAKGVVHKSAPVRTRTEAMISACDLKRGVEFVGATDTKGETITKTDLEAWRQANETMLKGRASPRQLDRLRPRRAAEREP